MSNTHYYFQLSYLLLLLCLCCSTTLAQQQDGRVSVRVAGETVINCDQFTLGHIAVVQATNAAEVERLRAIPLGYAPNVGTVREITRERIRISLTAAHFDDVQLDMPPVVRLTRASQVVDAKLLHDAAEEEVLQRFRSEKVSVRVVHLMLPPQVEVPAGKLQVSANANGIRNFNSPFALMIEVRVEGRIARRLSVTAQVEVISSVFVARRDLAPGESLSSDDVALEEIVLKRQPSVYLRDPKHLRGYSLRRPIARGEALVSEALTQPLVVKAGDSVRIMSEAGGVRITATGEARGSGRVGDRVRVKNAASNQMLQGIVMDEGLVQVQF